MRNKAGNWQEKSAVSSGSFFAAQKPSSGKIRSLNEQWVSMLMLQGFADGRRTTVKSSLSFPGAASRRACGFSIYPVHNPLVPADTTKLHRGREYVYSSRLIEPAPAAVRNCQVSVPEHLNCLVTNVHDLSFNPSSTRRGVPWGKDL